MKEVDNILGKLFYDYDSMNRLVRKYGGNFENLTEYHNQTEQKLKNLINGAERYAELNKEKENLLAKIDEVQKVLTEERKLASQNLSAKLQQELQTLGMPNAKMEIAFDKITERYSRTGVDKVEFMFSSNLGFELKPLNKVVSGGEMSRVMLAYKIVVSAVDNIHTIVFDEIEKADPEVLKVLLTALDEGIADDGRGNTLSFRGSVIIFTSNLGCNNSNKNVGSLVMAKATNEETMTANIKEALKDYFKPEFIGRIDHFIVFKALSKENVLDILKLRLKELQASNSNYASLKVSEDELKTLVDKSNVKDVGARCIPNVLKKYLLSKLTKSVKSLKEDR